MTDKATYDDYCIWKHLVSDNGPTQREFEGLSESALRDIKFDADRCRRIQAQYDEDQKKARKRAARVR